MPRVVLVEESVAVRPSDVDVVLGSNVLYLTNPGKIRPSEVLRVRKRMCGPVTTPVVEAMLRDLAGMPRAAPSDRPTGAGLR